MKRKIFKAKLLGAVAVATSMGFASPAAAAVCIGISANGGPISNITCNNVASGKDSYVANAFGYAFDVSGTGFPLLSMPQLSTQTLDIRRETTGFNTIDVYVTQTGLTAFFPGLVSTFTSNTMSGVTATISSYYDASNTQFGLANLLQSSNFTGAGVFSDANLFSTSGLWSETVKYTLNFTGGAGSQFNGTANLTAVPEPATWAMMLLGFGGIGAAMRRRRKTIRLAQIA